MSDTTKPATTPPKEEKPKPPSPKEDKPKPPPPKQKKPKESVEMGYEGQNKRALVW